MAEIEDCFSTRLQLNGMSHKTISLTRSFWPEQSWLLNRNSVRFRHRSIVWSRHCERWREQGSWWATPASVTTTRGSLAACVGMCVIQGLQGLINTHNLQFVSHYSFFSLSPSLSLALSLLCTLFLSVSTLICDCVLLFVLYLYVLYLFTPILSVLLHTARRLMNISGCLLKGVGRNSCPCISRILCFVLFLYSDSAFTSMCKA